MSQPAAAARTPGPTRPGAGEYVFDLAKVNHILGGPITRPPTAPASRATVIVGLMRMPAGTGHNRIRTRTSNGSTLRTFRAKIGDQEIEAKPARWSTCRRSRASGGATPGAGMVFFTVKTPPQPPGSRSNRRLGRGLNPTLTLPFWVRGSARWAIARPHRLYGRPAWSKSLGGAHRRRGSANKVAEETR